MNNMMDDIDTDDDTNVCASDPMMPSVADEMMALMNLNDPDNMSCISNMITPPLFAEEPFLTADQPMLCIDSGFSTAECFESSFKPAQMVFEETPDLIPELLEPEVVLIETPTETPVINPEHQVPKQSHPTWLDIARRPVLSVSCKDAWAELHKSRFGSGVRGKCIKHKNIWYTPSEFETFCGRGSSKDWKRSIRFGGQSISALVKMGILTPHALSCNCAACSHDQSVVGPVRLFTPYTRKKKRVNADKEVPVPKKKAKKTESVKKTAATAKKGTLPGENPVPVEKCTTSAENASPAENSASSSQNCAQQANTAPKGRAAGPSELNMCNNLCADLDKLARALQSTNLRNILETNNDLIEFQELVDTLKDRLDVFSDQLVDARMNNQSTNRPRVETPESDPEPYEVQPINVLGINFDLPDDANLVILNGATSKMCKKCRHKALSVCSMCQRTPYCSLTCLRQHWNIHQMICVRPAALLPAVALVDNAPV